MERMIYLPVPLILFLIFLLLVPFIWFAVTIDVVQIAAAKLGFSPTVGLILLSLIILGSAFNIPLYRTESTSSLVDELSDLHRQLYWRIPFHKVKSVTVVALNVGGGLIPTLLALYQFWHADALSILLVTGIVTLVTYFAAHVIPGIGIQMNALVAPITASLAALSITNTHPSAVAFAGGVLGTLLGADLLHFKDMKTIGAGIVSIGGAGVFDGIALCGLFSLLLT